MPRTTELKSEEAAVSSPLRRSCRIVAVNSPHPVKGRRLSATSENNVADEKNETKPSRTRRAASVNKEDTEPKIEPAKPRTRRSSATAEPTVVEEEKKEPATRSRRSSVAEEPAQETLKPVKTRRSSITDDAAESPADGKSTEGEGKSKTVTRRRSISKEPSDEAEQTKPLTRSRRRSMDKDVEVEILEKKPTRQRRASTEKQDEPTRVAKLTPIKNKRRPSVTDNAVVLEPIEEVETERKSLSPPPISDTSLEQNAAAVKKKHEPSKADLDLSIINECSFTEGNNSHTEEPISTSETSTGPLMKSDEMETKIETKKLEIAEKSAAPADSTTPPKETKNEGTKSTTPKKSPQFRASTDSETAMDDIGNKAQNNTENPKLSPGLQDDVKKETSSETILNKSQASTKRTPEKMSKPEMDVGTTESLDKPKQISSETTVSPRKSPRILARKENCSDQREKELRTLDSNSTMGNVKETGAITSTTEKIPSATPGKEETKSLHQTIFDLKNSDLKGSPQKESNVEDDSAFSSKSGDSQKKESATHISTGSEDSFRFHLSNSRLDFSPGENEEDDVLNVSKISNSSDKENIAVNMEDDSVKSKAPPSVEKKVLGDLSTLNEKLSDLKQASTVARVSNVFRPKNLDFSFVEPMDVDKTAVDLESTTTEKLDRTKLHSWATDDSINESFKLNLSMTPVESPITTNVFDSPKKVIEINNDKLDVNSEKVISVESEELIVDISEASCAALAVESKDSSNVPISREAIVEMKEESREQKILNTTNNLHMSTILEETVYNPDAVECKDINYSKLDVNSEKVISVKSDGLIVDISEASCVAPPVESKDINNEKLDVNSEKVISVESEELIVDISEASCTALAVESKDISNVPIFRETIVEMKEESREREILNTTNDLNMSTILEETVNNPDEQNVSKIVEDQSGDEKTSMSPDYDFQLPSDESSSEVDNKLAERPSSPTRDESRALTVEEENKNLVDADKELKPSDKEICGKLHVEQPERSLTTILIESEEMPYVEKEKPEMEKTANRAASATETKETIVETVDTEMVINQDIDETTEKPSSLEISKFQETETEIEQKQIKIDGIKNEFAGKIEIIPEDDKSTINNSIVETIEIAENPKVVLENIPENETHIKTDFEEISNEKWQIDGQDKKAMEEEKQDSETSSDDLKSAETSDVNSLLEMTNIKTSAEVQTGRSTESMENLLSTDLIKTGDDSMSTEVPTEENYESSYCSVNTIVNNEGEGIDDTESAIVEIDSPSPTKIVEDNYEEMERSFQDIVQDDEVKSEKTSESPMSQPTSELKKSMKKRKSKGRGLDNIKSDINQMLFEQHAIETNSPQKINKGNVILDNSEWSTEDNVLDATSYRTPKKAKKNAKHDATADKTDETTVGTEQIASSNVDNASEFKLSKDKKKSEKSDIEDVASNLGETDINTDAESTKESFTKTPKKAKKKAKVIKLTDDSTEPLPVEGPTPDEVKNIEIGEEPNTKKKKNKKLKLRNTKNPNESTHEKHPLEGFCHPKLDEIIDKMVLETKIKKEHAIEEEDSSDHEYASEEEEDEDEYRENPYLDNMAEEGEEDTPSEGSNDIIDEGESINTTESERETDDDYDDDDSFICDGEVVELLSGDDEYNLGDEEIKKRRKSRIINVEECDSDVIRIERKKTPEEPKKRSRIISVSSSSEDEKDESLKEVVEVLEPSVELKGEESSEKPKKRKSSITIIENINVDDIQDTVLSQRIHHLVDSFCTTIPRQSDISMNLSLEYADKDEEPSTKTHKQKSTRTSLSQTSPKEMKTKQIKGAKKRGSSTDETVVPSKKQRLNDNEDLQEDKSNKRKRLSKSLEDINIKKSKKKKSTKKNEEVEDLEVPNKKRRYSENDLRSKTFSLINQLITDVKNRPRRAVKPSTSKVDSSIDDSWDVEVATVRPSTSIVSKKDIEKYKFNKLHPKDFRNQMLYSSRVKRIETKKLLKKKGAYS